MSVLPQRILASQMNEECIVSTPCPDRVRCIHRMSGPVGSAEWCSLGVIGHRATASRQLGRRLLSFSTEPVYLLLPKVLSIVVNYVLPRVGTAVKPVRT